MRMVRKSFALILLFVLLVAFSATAGAASKINEDGYYKGIRLAGRVRIVESFADVKVQVVNSFPDLRVKVVSSFPDDIGEFVESFPDIKIQYVESFPGVE